MDTAPPGPQIVFSTGVTVDVVDITSRQTSQTTHIIPSSQENEEPRTEIDLEALSAAPQAAAAAVLAERERARRRVARARERRATVVLGIVMVSFIGCWLPFFFLYPLSLLLDLDIPAPLFAVIFWLGYCNSALNPIIYTIFNREFRAAFRRMLCLQTI